MRQALYGLLGCLLPQPERAELERRRGGNPAAWSFALGIVEFVGGARLLYDDAMRTMQRLVLATSGAMFERLEGRASEDFDEWLAFTWSGALGWAGWAIRPWTWVLVSIPAVGLLRVVSYMSNQEAVGEPAVWLGLRLWGLARRRFAAAAERRRFGPERADRVRREADGSLLVLAARPRPEWNERVTIQIGERFYRMVGHHLRHDGGVAWHGYTLREADPNEIIRRLVLYQPPPEPPVEPPRRA
jgi:hypothetical protein